MNVARLVPFRWLCLTVMLLPSALFCEATVRADDVRETTSLKFAPADVEFYSTSLRLREQYDAFVNSNAFATLSQMPSLQMGLGMMRMMWDNPQDPRVAEVKAALEQPENKQLIAMLLDAISHEVFMYGGDGYGELLDLMNDFNRVNREAQVAAMRGEGRPEDLVPEKMMELLADRLDDLKIPNTMIGFRISDPQRAKDQLVRLEELVQGLIADEPTLQGSLSRENIGGAEYLTLSLNGNMVPWDVVMEEVDRFGDTMEEIAEKVKPMTLTISLGVWEDYLILATGANTDQLKTLGQGARLVDRPELKPIGQYAEHPVASVGYVSESFMDAAQSADRQIDDVTGMAQQLLPMARLDAELEQELVADIGALADAIKAHLPEAGAATGLSFMTDRGFEGYQWSWAERPTSDSSQKLTILQHLGGNPIMFIAGRGKYDAQCYDAFSTFVGRAFYYAEKIGLREMGDVQRELYNRLRAEMVPLVKRMDQVTREKVVPAMNDGQMAVVIDAQSTSAQWHQAMPPTEQPLPMLEIAEVYGVSDAESIREAGGEYFAILQEMLDKAHEVEPTQIPGLQLPAPDSRDFPPHGTVYYYRLPQRIGLDKQIAPAVGLSDNVLVFSLMPLHIKRLLTPTPLSATGGPLADIDRPLAGAVQVNLGAFFEAITPWIDYGFSVASDENQDPTLEMIKGQVKTALKVLACFRGVTTVTYQEDDAWVTHYEVQFQDLP